ncbi:n-acetylglutamate synthase [uncultured Algibacter sp.]|uniref:n-acetylglutamate synthase n=1 Tax=uncultured Algibacter sp. TaxID=298659 RepID=UPI00260AD1DD|nr:n-acetylglutamate synthase [uncultured Algibacter sp.]
MINYNNKSFRLISSTENSETSSDTIFHYKQNGNILTSTYKGGSIIEGHLIGLVDEDGTINMSYHQINTNGELMTGTCISKPKIDSDGKITLYENWKWTSGNKSKGTSVLEEI